MPLLSKKTLLTVTVLCATLAAAAASAQAPTTQTSGEEGPGGRTQLTRWTLRRDPSDRGLSLGWQRGRFTGATVSVPNDVDPTQWSGRSAEANYDGSVAWYRTSFHAANAGVYALEFQSANFLANVWVDGRALGSHRGSYLPFQMRYRLAAGTHTVVVRIDWRGPAEQARVGFHRTWFNWGGLNGDVDVRPVGQSELSQPRLQTTLSSDAGQATVQVSVDVHNYGPARTLVPEGSLVRGAQTIALSFPGLALAPGQSATAVARVTVSDPALWSPASPNLYELTLAVGQEPSYSAHVGLRQLTWHGGRMYLNGQRLQLHGATVQEDAQGHGDALTPGDEDRIVAELKAIGANAARAQHPLAAGLLERLDAAGILVWQGIGPVEGAGNWYSHTPKLLAEAEQQARTAVLAEQLHPSVIAWNLVDEAAGNGHDEFEVRYVRTLAHWLHEHDPTRMVAVDVWGDHPPQQAGALYSDADAISETDYSGWYDYPHDTPAQLAGAMRARLAAMQRTFAGKVLVISEFGAESNTLNPPGSPGSYAFQARLLAAHVAVYESDPQLSGMLVYLLRDYPLTPTFDGGSVHAVLPKVKLIEGLDQKGLFTYAGQAKPAVALVARLFGTLPAV
ncbi:MAG TPA: glycoside hydrolase family 2 TIM barrel-domain containing protein [Solirubrobacteraceae bacterium]|nr:glycoside hydrolase family 2 TIM barrel-domain containing protein [Solirubrobacteraceae bacterium]